MRQTVEEIANRLDEIERADREKSKFVKKQLIECRNRMSELNEAIETETDPEKFNSLLNQRTENENRFQALHRQSKAKNSHPLTEEEFSQINNRLNSELNDLKTERAPQLLESVRHTMAMMNDYFREAEIITHEMEHAAYLAHGTSFCTHDLDISKLCGDSEKMMEAFVRSYFLNCDVFRKIEG